MSGHAGGVSADPVSRRTRATSRPGDHGGLDERADAAMTLARELQDSARRSRETVRQLRDYLAAKGTSGPRAH